MKQKNILILGGSRFIGYLMLLELAKKNYNITIFNRQLSVPPDPFPKKINFIRGDRNIQQDLECLFDKQYDVVIDFSGYAPNHVEPIITKHSARIAQYIFISTVNVYKKPYPKEIIEDSPKNSNDKLLTEDILFKFKEKLPITIFRPQGVFGPYDPCLAGLLFYRITKYLPILVRRNMNVRANHLFVYDLIKAIDLSINNPKVYGKVYNIAGDDKVTLNDFINLCSKICSINPITKYDEIGSKFNNTDFVKKKRHVDFHAEWPENDKICKNNLIKDELKIKFTNIKESLETTYLWLIKDKQRLNYFSLRGEKYILLYRSIPYYKKIFWKFIDFFNNLVFRFKKKLKNIFSLEKLYKLTKKFDRHT